MKQGAGGLGLMLVEAGDGHRTCCHSSFVSVSKPLFQAFSSTPLLQCGEAQEQRLTTVLCILWTLLKFLYLQSHFEVFVGQIQQPVPQFFSDLLLNVGPIFFFTFLIISG